MLYVKSKSKDMVDDPVQIDDIVKTTLSRMANIASKTLGPGGRPVLIEREGLPPLVTKDGITVIKSLGMPNAAANTVLDTCKEISLNTARDAGDGTTTAIVLADAIVRAGSVFMMRNKRYNPQRFVNELRQCYEKVVKPYLKDVAIQVKSDDDLKRVALISANGDQDVAEVVVKAFMAAGEDGHILIQEDQGGGMRVETVDGFIVTSGLKDLGSIGSVFINDRANQQVRMDEGLVVLFDGTLNDLVLPAAIQSACEADADLFGKPIIIMAHGFADPVIEKCLKTSKSGVTVLPVKVPKSTLANSRTMFLQDMAAYTSASVIDPATAASFSAEHFGRFSAVKVNTYETFVQCESDGELIDERVSELKAIMSAAHSEHDRAHLRAAIAKLTGGISTVWVGGMTDAEVRERRDRVQDAVEAVRSAVAEGIVAGGCATHLALAKRIRDSDSYYSSPAWSILAEALEHPFKVLLANCGEFDRHAELYSAIIESSHNHIPRVVFDANQHEVVDPFKSGIVEPAKVHRVAIGNALSVASLMVTLGGIVVAPRDYNLETQMELSKAALKDMMNEAGQE
jgi:chaperonin GroEL